MNTSTTSVCFRIVLVATLVTIIFGYMYLHVSPELHIFVSTESSSATRNLQNDVYSPERSPYIDPKLHMHVITENKTILWWNAPGWMIRNMDMSQCEYKNCKVSFNREDFDNSNAVIYSIGDGKKIGQNPPVTMEKRNGDQAWVFFTLESPVLTASPSPHWHNAFNWSWTYRPNSDIFNPSGWLHTKTIRPKRNYSEIFRQKTGQVAWVVSHCNTVGKRDDYVRVLNKYITVDIYGKCGKNRSRVPKNIGEIIGKKYKFYLGFENALCRNYFTEKFFHYYQFDMINVVRGKTNYSDYLPAHSYIDTANFSSIRALGEFLKELSENEQEFIQYLKIKDMYEVSLHSIVLRDSHCNICGKLNNLEKNRKTYRNVKEWLGTCDKATDLKET